MSETAAPPAPAYANLMRELRELEIFASIGSLLGWDRETMMPRGGTALRAEQAAVLGALVHERFTSQSLGDLLQSAEAEPPNGSDADVTANLREVRRAYDRAVRLPTSLVRDLAETTTHAQVAWRQAREQSDFSQFAPWLEKVVELTKRKAECLLPDDSADLYDGLLDGFEPGARSADIADVFTRLRARLAPVIREIADAARRPSDRVHTIHIPIARQEAFNRRVAEQIGFDFEAGRLDTSTHPFCQGIGPGDTRLTTRYREDGFFEALSSTLHEGGHGLYEQNLPKAERLGEPLSDAVSLGVHESQSRMWENIVGRSREFWVWALPEAKREFGELLDGVDVDEVYGAMNIVRPNLIRVESDEATYNLHIMLRFDLERAMLSGELPIAEIPGVWNERIRSDLGLQVPDDRRGCLQDVHWSMGAIGYFPTYTLGNLYAAQFWGAATAARPGLPTRFERGEFRPLLDWLIEQIHQHGKRYTAPELCVRVTGTPLSADPFLGYLENKLRPLYGL